VILRDVYQNDEKNDLAYCTGTSCCGGNKEEVTATDRKKITIDFLFLDLSVCTRWQGAENSLDEAFRET